MQYPRDVAYFHKGFALMFRPPGPAHTRFPHPHELQHVHAPRASTARVHKYRLWVQLPLGRAHDRTLPPHGTGGVGGKP